MYNKYRFNDLLQKIRLRKIRNWMEDHHFPSRFLFFLTGLITTLWFLIRVIPKPSRASYPCMKIAAPFMSGFILYLLSLGGTVMALRKVKMNILRAKYTAAVLFVLAAVVIMLFSLTHGNNNTYASNTQTAFGPDDGPNQPFGEGQGINPGRVVWAWNPEATNENCVNNFETQDWFFKPENTHSELVGKMVRDAIIALTGEKTISKSWNELFRYHNLKKENKKTGYKKGEKIFIKINQGTARSVLSEEDRKNGFYYSKILTDPRQERRKTKFGATETGPYVVLELLRELVNEAGIKQSDITVGDPMTEIYGHNYEVWSAEFPDIVYTSRVTTDHGRTIIHPTEKDLLYYSNKTQTDKLYDVIENADYLINVACLKPHAVAGISLTAKNHFGSQARESAFHLHSALLAPVISKPTNTGYHKYRNLVDLMGSKYLGQNTLLFVVEALFGGGAKETGRPVKYLMKPFNNDWSSSFFISQDQVALESVCYDFLRTEWNGINKHDPVNNTYEDRPNMNGVDDYLHQAADSSTWPEGIIYDPDNSGKPIPSLGVHEHWNNAEKKQYSRNLGYNYGIELFSIPDTLVKNEKSAGKN